MLPTAANLAALRADLDEVHRSAVSTLSDRHYRHLVYLERWIWGLAILGYGTAWLGPNPIAMVALGLSQSGRWTILAHHILHRGYDRFSCAPRRHTSRGFAQGWRRFIDWPDWLAPRAWSFEHNVLHHGHTGERLDPDLVEKNWTAVRQLRAPVALKWLVIGFFAWNWKLTYYAPNTLWLIRQRSIVREGQRSTRVDHVAASKPTRLYHGIEVLLPFSPAGREFWRECVLPNILFRFVLLPALFLPLGAEAAVAVLVNSIGAEVLTNLHTYAIVVPNHAGEDLERFDSPPKNKAEFYYRQVVGSTNYPGGSAWRDFLCGYLNYQIEHHLWPNLPALAYREIAPAVRRVCEKHGVPYTVEPVWIRCMKTAAIMTGQSSMRAPPKPLEVSAEGR